MFFHWWWWYPPPSEGWGRGGTPRRPNSRTSGTIQEEVSQILQRVSAGAAWRINCTVPTSRRLNVVVRSLPLYPRGGPKWRDNYPEGPDHPVALNRFIIFFIRLGCWVI